MDVTSYKTNLVYVKDKIKQFTLTKVCFKDREQDKTKVSVICEVYFANSFHTMQLPPGHALHAAWYRYLGR